MRGGERETWKKSLRRENQKIKREKDKSLIARCRLGINLTSFYKMKGTIVGAFAGLIIGVVLYASVWVTPYVRGMPWSTALFLDIIGYWILAQYNFTPGAFVILVFMAFGGFIGTAIDSFKTQ
jgi:hypothetical protein